VSCLGERMQAILGHSAMPRISEFYGIIIAMYYSDHAPPHFHAIYAEHEALIDLNTLDILQGSVPRRALALT
jgi:hypothetical protein